MITSIDGKKSNKNSNQEATLVPEKLMNIKDEIPCMYIIQIYYKYGCSNENQDLKSDSKPSGYCFRIFFVAVMSLGYDFSPHCILQW